MPNHLKTYAAACLLGALALAILAPARIAASGSSLSGYVRHVELFLLQIVPYALCAVLWLPWRAPTATRIGLALSLALLLVACVLYIPMLARPTDGGGDMIGLAFGLIAITTTLGVLGASLVAFVLARRRLRDERG